MALTFGDRPKIKKQKNKVSGNYDNSYKENRLTWKISEVNLF